MQNLHLCRVAKKEAKKRDCNVAAVHLVVESQYKAIKRCVNSAKTATKNRAIADGSFDD